MEAPVTLENCDVFMFPFCLAQREFCFLLLTVASPVYQSSLLKTWKSCWLPLPCLHSCVLCTMRQHILLLWYTLFYILYYYGLSLCPVFAALTANLNSREFNYNWFPCLWKTAPEGWSMKGMVVPPLLPSDSSLSIFWNTIYEFSSRPATWLLQFLGFHLILEQSTQHEDNTD